MVRSSATFQELEVVIHALPPSAPSPEQLDLLCTSLSNFVAANDNPATSPHLKATTPDRVEALVGLLGRPEVQRSSDATILALKALKILARRQDNRLRCGGHALQALLPYCSPKQPPAVASEAANAVLNLAYEAANVQHLVRCRGEAALLALLDKGGEEVLANASGAVQTVCYQKEGREAVRRAGGIPVLVRLLQRAESTKARQRTVGALHNLSSEAEAVKALRMESGIPVLAAMLQSGDAGTAAAAVGALSNVSREPASCQVLLGQPGALEALAALLASEDVQVAACAAGVLLNVHRTHTRGSEGSEGAQGIKRGIAGVVAAAAIYSSLYAAPPDMQQAG